MGRPPLRDVAAKAGVSEPTVSRVLNGRRGVAPATRERVIEALESLGFHDVPAARGGGRGVVGIVSGELSNPVFPTLVDHIMSELARRDLIATVYVPEPSRTTEERCVRELVHTAVDAIVFIGGVHAQVGSDLSHYESLIEDGLPIVLVNGEATDLDVAHVRCDERAGAVKAATHLLRLGHRRIGCIVGSRRFVPTRRIVDGYRATLEEAGVTAADEDVVETSFTFEGARAGATRLFRSGTTGIVTSNDLMALGAIHAALSAGLQVPGDVSVVGYDGTDLTAFTNPPLTTLRQPFEDMAELIANAVTAELEGSTRYQDHFVFEPELVARESTSAVLESAVGA